MLVPLSWLKDYLSFNLADDELSDLLTLAGLEVDKIEKTVFSFHGVVIGEVIEAKPHPNADKLKVTQVSDGTETVQVVCGDPSCEVGMKVAFAKVGATLAGEGDKVFKIKKAKLRDVESFGMLCSEEELDLAETSNAIMQLPADAPVGQELTELLGDTIIEVSLTPNLGHCMSMLGVARELAAMIDQKAIRPEFKLKETEGSKAADAISVEIQNPEACPRYCCRLIRNVKVGPSPLWIQKRLEAAGVRAINNIVDVTNYVMLASGQPLHAFDYEKIGGAKISVQLTDQSFVFKTLDEEKRTIPKDTLMIYDQTKPIAIAGVMGGADSEVEDKTRHILLEAAHFNASAVRRASKTLGLRSESSARFERGIDHHGVISSLDEAAFLIQEIAGGEIAEGSVDIEPIPMSERKIKCRISRVNQILGTKLSCSEVESFLSRLEMEVKALDADTLDVSVPSYRNDIHQEIDLIEEVARIFGYNNITHGEGRVINSDLTHSPLYIAENEIRTLLLREGLQEFLTCDLISPELSKLSLEKSLSEAEAIHVLQPSSIDQSILRTSLLPGLLQSVKHNFDRQRFDLSVFETGRIHFKDGSKYNERICAAVLLTGKSHPNHWKEKSKEVDFFDLKGILENTLEKFGISNASFSSSHLQSFHPGKQATINVGSIQVGTLGEVHPSRLEPLDIKQRVFFAQIDLHDLCEVRKPKGHISPLPQFPGSDRDWTLTLKQETPMDRVMTHLRDFKSKLLKDYYLLDLYESEKIGSDRKNITMRFIYRDDSRTVKQEEVDKEHARLTETLMKKLEETKSLA